MERMERAGPAFLQAISDREKKLEDAALKDVTETTLDKLLSEYPPDLVCARTVRALDGDGYVTDIQAWVDETHPDVLKHVAVEVLTASGLVPETETDQGEDSGGSSAS